MDYRRFPASDIVCIRGPMDDGYVGSGWEMFHVPGKDYGEEPISFLVKKSSLSRYAAYDPEPITDRRRSISEFRSYDPTWPRIMERYYRSRNSHSATNRPSRRSLYDYSPNVHVDDYVTDRASVHMRKSLPPSSVPILHKSPIPLGRRVQYIEPDSTADIFDAKREMKHDIVKRGVLKQDMNALLHKLYAAKATANVRSATDFNLAEIRRLDRKQGKLSKYIQDFKLDTVKQRLPYL